MARKKAAIQMSLGLIVAVVFAVVLLTLAITWIQGMIGDITQITEDLTKQAETKLRDTFAETSTNFAIWPTHYDMKPGESVKLLAGVKNNAPDSIRHDFVINVVPAGASYSICPEGDVSQCDSPEQGVTLAEFMSRWVTVERTVSSIEVQTTAYKSLTIEAPKTAPSGSYIFNVVACYDRTGTGSIVTPSSFDCEGDSLNIWSNAASLTIAVSR
jgi:hypothetical protein